MTGEGKVCTKCGEWKPAERFNKRVDVPDGRDSACKQCRNAYMRERYAANESVRQEYAKRAKKWRDKHPGYTNKQNTLQRWRKKRE